MRNKITDKIRRIYHYNRYKKVKQMLGDTKNILDIGCGKPCESMQDGSFIKYLGYGTGIDIKNCSGFSFKQGSILNIQFPKKSFDAVVCMEILEHIEDIDLALKNVHSVLKDNGIFLMSTPNNKMLYKIFWFFWEKTIGKMWEHKHITNLNKKQWVELLNKYFDIISIKNHWHILLIIKMKKKLI